VRRPATPVSLTIKGASRWLPAGAATETGFDAVTRPGDTRDGNATNRQAAALLRDYAALLEAQDANPFRINAWRRGAQTLESLDRDVAAILEEEGTPGLEALPGIGEGIAAALREIIGSGRFSQLDRLRGESDPLRLFQSIPGIGPALARMIHDSLDVDTLEALEIAAHDGRLEQVEGIGERRAAGIRASLAQMLGRGRRRRAGSHHQPPVHTLLEVDRQYRAEAAAGRLKKIAPRRFNPDGSAWLPIMHADREGWHFTALYSNTARAHELGKTDDWVVIYYYDDDHQEGQCTVVTETRGRHEGERVVRGREAPGSARD
jgi:hypothetical protein